MNIRQSTYPGWNKISSKFLKQNTTSLTYSLDFTKYPVYMLRGIISAAGTIIGTVTVNADNAANYDTRYIRYVDDATTFYSVETLNTTAAIISSGFSGSGDFGTISNEQSEQLVYFVRNTNGLLITAETHTNGSGQGDMHNTITQWDSGAVPTSVTLKSDYDVLVLGLPLGSFLTGSLFELYVPDITT